MCSKVENWKGLKCILENDAALNFSYLILQCRKGLALLTWLHQLSPTYSLQVEIWPIVYRTTSEFRDLVTKWTISAQHLSSWYSKRTEKDRISEKGFFSR